ncbi:zinc-ribbon domain-containing protein [Cellulophaga baltica 4]|nr:zinc-ribbon domain-containing protein [Cellulophaga baltica 4]
MKVFQCGNCNHSVFFENYSCENCGHLTGFRAKDRKMLTFKPNEMSLFSDRQNIEYKYCKNKEYNVCNWVLKKVVKKTIVLLVSLTEPYQIFQM